MYPLPPNFHKAQRGWCS